MAMLWPRTVQSHDLPVHRPGWTFVHDYSNRATAINQRPEWQYDDGHAKWDYQQRGQRQYHVSTRRNWSNHRYLRPKSTPEGLPLHLRQQWRPWVGSVPRNLHTRELRLLRCSSRLSDLADHLRSP